MDEIVGVEISRQASVAVAAFKTTCISDVEAIASIGKKVREFIEENRPSALIFDFGGVKFFSSQVLGLILDVRARLETYDAEVAISAINPQLHRVFRITNLDKIFRFFPDRESAVKEVGSENAD
jgi:anti-sigma B factor antagonist